jgi:hypothetical protein
MSWRWVPPARSPVSLSGLARGLGTVLGLRDRFDDGVASALKARYDASDGLLTDSGTSALILALRAILPKGGTVAYPAYACVDLTSAALGAGVKVRLYDLDPVNLSPDLDSVRDVLGRGVDAIVVAHLFGYPADVSAVQSIAMEYGIPVIEDAAQGAGGELNGKVLGSLADISILSFGRGKGMTAGSGGAALVRSSLLADWAPRITEELETSLGGRELIFLSALKMLAHPLLYRIPSSIPGLRLGEMIFHPPKTPRAMSATGKALLQTAIEMDEAEIAKRRARARGILAEVRLRKGLSPVRVVAGGEAGYLRLALLDSTRSTSHQRTLGMAWGYPITLDEQIQLRPILLPMERAGKGSMQLRDRLFTLPTHSGVTDADASRLVAWLGATSVSSQVALAAAPVS